MARQVLTLPDIPASVLTQAVADARYPLKSDVDPYPQYLTAARADPLYLNVGGDSATGQFFFSSGSGGNGALCVLVTGDSQPRWFVQNDGTMRWGAGAGTDTLLQRTGAATLGLTGSLNPEATNARDLGTTALRWRKAWAVDADLSGALNVAGAATFTSAPTVGGSPLLTQSAGDARYLQPATAASTYVPLAGGSVMTGLLGPSTTNTRDLGTSALRWRKGWAVDADYSGSVAIATALTVAANAVALSPNANQTLQWLANGFFSDAPTKAQYDALVARVTALEGQMGSGATGHYHPMGTWRNTAKAVIPAGLMAEEAAAA